MTAARPPRPAITTFPGRMAPNLVGTVLGDRYRLLRVLGEGGMGTVYLRKAAQCAARAVAHHAVVPMEWSACRSTPSPHAF